jgi:hypothetical protein
MSLRPSANELKVRNIVEALGNFLFVLTARIDKGLKAAASSSG